MKTLIRELKTQWPNYLIEAWALGMFMVSACFFVILLEHPGSWIRSGISDPFLRRALIGFAMGITAVLLIYSSWGKRSGAHMNPAVTLAFWQLDRISTPNAVWYILAQFIGGTLGVLLFKITVPDLIQSANVNYVVTVPGMAGKSIAFLAEFLMSFILFSAVLVFSNSKLAGWTGWVAGFLLLVFISFEAPFSGMSINPARTIASAFPANVWAGWWLYFLAPIGGMMLAGYLYRRIYRIRSGGECLSMKCHLSGFRHDCETYEVLGPFSDSPDPEILTARSKDLKA